MRNPPSSKSNVPSLESRSAYVPAFGRVRSVVAGATDVVVVRPGAVDDVVAAASVVEVRAAVVDVEPVEAVVDVAGVLVDVVGAVDVELVLRGTQAVVVERGGCDVVVRRGCEVVVRGGRVVVVGHPPAA